jgi:hypothetical protein
VERIHVELQQANVPVAGQQRRHRQQAKRREGGPFADEAYPVLKPPVRDGETRVYEQGIYRVASPRERPALRYLGSSEASGVSGAGSTSGGPPCSM